MLSLPYNRLRTMKAAFTRDPSCMDFCGVQHDLDQPRLDCIASATAIASQNNGQGEQRSNQRRKEQRLASGLQAKQLMASLCCCFSCCCFAFWQVPVSAAFRPSLATELPPLPTCASLPTAPSTITVSTKPRQKQKNIEGRNCGNKLVSGRSLAGYGLAKCCNPLFKSVPSRSLIVRVTAALLQRRQRSTVS